MSVQRTDNTSPFTAGAWAHQDGLRVHGDHLEGRSHVEQRWDRRCRAGWEGYPIRVAWREGVPVRYSDGDEVAARHHAPAAVVLVARLGIIKTVIPDEDVDAELSDAQSADRYREYRYRKTNE